MSPRPPYRRLRVSLPGLAAGLVITALPGCASHLAPPPEPLDQPTSAPSASESAKPPVSADDGMFDRGAAVSAMAASATAAKSCKTATTPTGTGKLRITFSSRGNVGSATLESGPWVGTPVEECIVGAYRGARVTPWDGAPITVTTTIQIE